LVGAVVSVALSARVVVVSVRHVGDYCELISKFCDIRTRVRRTAEDVI
jgi:hypothetical protein